VNDYQSALHPAGPFADRLGSLWEIFLFTTGTVWLLVLLFLALAVWRGSRRTEPDNSEEGTRISTRWVSGALVLSTLILFALLGASVAAGRAVTPNEADVATREIRVNGHQWWWEFQYTNPRADRIVTTANELHLPAGERIRLVLRSSDVIHSFWIPNLHGKHDLIPGKTVNFVIQADRPGLYRAQCAEFCGLQHARMGFIVVVEPRAQFEKWYARQLLPAPIPKTADQQRGQTVFLGSTCVMCHTIKGTPAGARLGPDLTHIGSRLTIGAATLPNTRGHRAGWIANAQSIKPGVLMPPSNLSPDDLNAVTIYLESLK
jgi:cytochrome c oxidase subunit 2